MQSVIYNVDIKSIEVVYDEDCLPTNSFVIYERDGSHVRVFLNPDQVLQMYSALGIIHAMYLAGQKED